MNIELFDERETTVEGQEPDDEALAIIKELGLQTDDSGEHICHPCPNAQQWFVIQTVFSQRTKIADYRGPIPLRVLKEARSYLYEHKDKELIICHQAMAMTKDPIMLAVRKGYYGWQSGSASDFNLIARWGDALEDWSELANKGAVALRKTLLATCETLIARLTVLKAMVPTMILRDNQIPTIGLYNMPEGV